MTKSGQRTVETHGRASLQPVIIQYFLRCLDFVLHSIEIKNGLTLYSIDLFAAVQHFFKFALFLHAD